MRKHRHVKSIALAAIGALVATMAATAIGTQAASATSGSDPTQSITCDAITADYHRPLTNGDHINATLDPPGGQVNMYVDQNIAGGASYNGQNNLGLRWKLFGVDQTPIPLTLDQVTSGVITFNYGAALKQQGTNSWKVTFVQTNGTDTWPGKECGNTPPPTPKDASASASAGADATCSAVSQVTFNILNATWDSEPDLTVGAHTRNATVVSGHLFADGKTTTTVNYTVKAQLPSQSTDPSGACYVPPPSTCINRPVYSYTFDSATGSGVVTVSGGKTEGVLCAPLYIRAAAYNYDQPASGSPSWSQTLNGYNDTLVDKTGTFPYSPPQIEACRQYDVYASFDGWGALALPEKLNGPNSPFEPTFLYDVLKGKGPNPTYSYTSSAGCNTPPPTPKDATASASVGSDATCTASSQPVFSIENATWDSEPDLTVGAHTRTATATDGHLFADGTNKATVEYTVVDKKASQSTDPKADCYVPPTPKVCTTIETGPTATNLDEAGWNHNDTRNTGAYEYVNGGIRLYTTDTDNPASSQNKVTLYRSVTPTPLAQFGEPSVVFADGGTGVKPGMQVGVDVDGNGSFDGYLVGEPWSYGDHNWWIDKPGFNVPGGMGYMSFGSWADFVAANPQAMVVAEGLSLGSGVYGDWTVESFTVNCEVFTFNHQEQPPKVAVFTPPTVNDVCGTVNDVVTLGTSDDGTFAVTSVTPLSDGRIRHRVVYTPNDGSVVPPPGESDSYIVVDGKAVWKLYTTNEACPPVTVDNNPHYQVVTTCGAVTLTFTNPVTLGENEVTNPAIFTYTDANGATQTVSVLANETVVKTIKFAEDSGKQTVKVGPKDGVQEEVAVQTDCVANSPTPTPTSSLAPSSSPTPSATPVAAPAQLGATGSNVVPLLVALGILMVVGIPMTVFGYRRRKTPEGPTSAA